MINTQSNHSSRKLACESNPEGSKLEERFFVSGITLHEADFRMVFEGNTFHVWPFRMSRPDAYQLQSGGY